MVAAIAINRMKLLKLLDEPSNRPGHLHYFQYQIAGRLCGHLTVSLEKGTFWVEQVRVTWKSQSWKSCAALAIDQTSDWSLAIHFVLNKLVACPTKCSVYFNRIFTSVYIKFLICLLSCSTVFNLCLLDAVNFVKK